MYIPLAIHKNELIVIDSMDTFSQFFCLAKKQKMTPLAVEAPVAAGHEEIEGEEEMKPFFEDDHSDSLSSDSGDEDDI